MVFFCPASLWKLQSYGSVKIIFETKINCFPFSKPKGTILLVKQQKTTSETNLLLLASSSAVVMTRTKIRTISKRFPSASEGLFKTTFCSFSRVSKHFWTKWVANSFFSANFMLIYEKWLWPLEYMYPFNNTGFINTALENSILKTVHDVSL